MRFKSMFDKFEPDSPVEYPKEVPIYTEITLPDGTVSRKVKEMFPFFDSIQSYEAECNLDNIIRRAQNGDYSVLDKHQGFYLDLSACPAEPYAAAQYLSEMAKLLAAQSADQGAHQDQESKNISENGKNESEVIDNAKQQ